MCPKAANPDKAEKALSRFSSSKSLGLIHYNDGNHDNDDNDMMI